MQNEPLNNPSSPMLLDSLNPSQHEAATAVNSHVRIIAGAGSGKTRVLIARIEHLIKDHQVNPYKICAITFTNKAAQEMQKRLIQQIPDTGHMVQMSTIHSLCVQILHKGHSVIDMEEDFSIIDTTDQKHMLKSICESLHLINKEKRFNPVGDSISFISRNKMKNIPPAICLKEAGTEAELMMARIYQLYETKKREEYSLDFDDLLILSKKVLESSAYEKEYWQNRFEHILVDEFQDVDNTQYEILKLITGPGTLVCVVGDPDQTIYTWRGADINNILHFPHDFKPCRTVFLNKNYRSTSLILEAGNAVAANNKIRIEKDLEAVNKKKVPISIEGYFNEEAEATGLASSILNLHKKGTPWNQIAILYRNNFCSTAIETAFRKNSIPYEITNGHKFYERAEIKTMLSYLKLVSCPDFTSPSSSSTNIAFERILNVPSRGIGETTLQKIRDFAMHNNCSYMQAAILGADLSGAAVKKVKTFCEMIHNFQNHTPVLTIAELTEHILEKSGFKESLENKQETARLAGIHELIEEIHDMEEEIPSLSLSEYLQNTALFTDKDKTQKDLVRMMTIHASKGMEFEHVFLSCMGSKIIPSTKTTYENGQNGLEEERRLFYVAITRAKKNLHISWSKDPSSFLKEIPAFCTNEKSETEKEEPQQDKTTSLNRFKKGDKVHHPIYGDGIFCEMKKKEAVISFPYGTGILLLNPSSLSLSKNSDPIAPWPFENLIPFQSPFQQSKPQSNQMSAALQIPSQPVLQAMQNAS